MAYFGSDHLRLALGELSEQGNAFLTTVLAMLASGVPVGNADEDSVPFGNPQDMALLEKYFRPAGGEPARPYYLPFGQDNNGSRWRDKKYASRTLQRLRSDWQNELFVHPDTKRYAFRPGFAKMMAARLDRFPKGKVSLAALTVWLMRQRDIASLDDAMKTTVSELKLDAGGFDVDFLDQGADEFQSLALGPIPLSDEEIATIIGASAPPPKPAARDDIQANILRYIKRRCRVDESLVNAVISAWMAHDIVVLVGSPGTGKTILANTLAASIEEALDPKYVDIVTLQITSEHDASRFLGYENLDGVLNPSEFTRRLLLEKAARLRTCVLVLDEWNLASIDDYLAPILSSIETGNPVSLPGSPPDTAGEPDSAEFQRSLPVDLFVIATCNSYREEPETRQKISRPVKRRSTIFTVPNFLAVDVEVLGASLAITGIADMILSQEAAAVGRRIEEKSATAFDYYRKEQLDKTPNYGAIDDDLRSKFESVVALLLALPSGRQYVTIGVVKDVVLNLVYARDGEQMATLGQQVAGKLLHLYEGPVGLIKPIVAIFAGTAAEGHVHVALADIELAAASTGGESTPLL